MNVWRLMTHHEDTESALRWTRLNNRIAMGWGGTGDIVKQGYRSRQEISAQISSWNHISDNAGQGGACLWAFCYLMTNDDLVILSTKRGRMLVVQVTGPYEWTEEKPDFGGDYKDYQHQRRVQITSYDANKLWHLAGGKPAKGYNPRWTLVRCANPVQQKSER
jgi:predicted Mrr-cat superfamily restriction endonuclease